MTAKRKIPINNHLSGDGADSLSASDTGTAGLEAEAGESQEPGRSAAEAAEAVSTPASDAGDAQGAEGTSPISERDALADSLLRLRAEFENYRRRASRELIDARVRAQGDLLNDFLPVLDNLGRALDAAEHHEEGKVLQGVRLTRNLFIELLNRSGVEEIEGVGTVFDPEVHDAMLVQPSDQDEGVVTAILERGYRQGDRILRPAKVIVSAGPGGDRPEAQGPDVSDRAG